MKVAIENRVKNTYNPSFTQYYGAEFYGTDRERDALKYRVQLTPEKVDNIFKNASSTDEGISRTIVEMNKEMKGLTDAFSGIDVINSHYRIISMQRFKEIAKERPHGSSIPYVGVAFDYLAKLTGGFLRRVGGYTDDIIEDYNQITKIYFEDSINSMVKDYRTVDDYFRNGIEFVSMRRGGSETIDQVSEALLERRKFVDTTYESLGAGLKGIGEVLEQRAAEIIKAHNKKQNIRMGIKTVRKLLLLA